MSYAGQKEKEKMVKEPTLREMLEAGVHFGHKTSHWHPRMKPYIFMAKNGVHVINLEKSQEMLISAMEYVKKLSSEGKKIIFVGSKKQASDIIKKAAQDCGMPYVNFRWVGGTLTNFEIIKQSIAKFKKQKEDIVTSADKVSKKELSKIRAEVEKGEKIFGGLTDLEKRPDALILFGSHDEKSAFKEAKTLNVPIVALVDTNTDPSQIDFPIPGNDDATKSIELFSKVLSNVIKENKGVVKAIEQK